MYEEPRSDLIDERWLREWVEFGFRELDRYLGNQAAFADWLRIRRQSR